MKYYTYKLQSEKDNSFYTGSTSDIERRLIEHNYGYNPYTSKKKPWKVIYFEESGLRSEAIKRENFQKNKETKNFI